MKETNKKTRKNIKESLKLTTLGFTLVELLAVIVILAIILVIAVPKIMDVINDAKKATLESTAKMIASQAEKQKVQNTVLGKTDDISCESVAKINDADYEDCDIDFDENTAKVTIKGSGKFNGLWVCNGTKNNATAINESCGLRTLTVNLDGGTDTVDYNAKYEAGSEVTLTEPTKEGYTFKGWIVTGTGASVNGNTLTIGSEATTVTATWKVFVAYGDGDTYIANLLANELTLNNGLVQTYATVGGQQVDAGIRYAGATADVKNKVYFNCAETDGTNAYGSENYNYESSCEIWRIIGVFDTKSTDSETEEAVPRIKIVRDEVLSTIMAWDTTADGVTYINQWGETTLASDNTTPYNGASLKQYLNGDYYNSLTSIAKGQIGTALWYTGAVEVGTASAVYEDERSDATGTGTTVNYTTKWSGMIGLIYPSDFGYAGTNCGDYTIISYDNESSCGKTSNWLTPSSGYHWTISPNASLSNSAWSVRSRGCAQYGDVVVNTSRVRPAAYLSSNVQIIGGDGSTVPYKLK